jgi:hypothetical protein
MYRAPNRVKNLPRKTTYRFGHGTNGKSAGGSAAHGHNTLTTSGIQHTALSLILPLTPGRCGQLHSWDMSMFFAFSALSGSSPSSTRASRGGAARCRPHRFRVPPARASGSACAATSTSRRIQAHYTRGGLRSMAPPSEYLRYLGLRGP